MISSCLSTDTKGCLPALNLQCILIANLPHFLSFLHLTKYWKSIGAKKERGIQNTGELNGRELPGFCYSTLTGQQCMQSIVVISIALNLSRSGLESWVCHLPDMWPWIPWLLSWCLIFVSGNVNIIMALSLNVIVRIKWVRANLKPGTRPIT
jgi:hypothetical protein